MANTLFIQRQIQSRIAAVFFKGKTLVLFGPHQVGKKTLDFVEESGGAFAGFEFKWGGGSARGARAFQAAHPGSTVQVIEPANVWDFAGVPVKGAET